MQLETNPLAEHARRCLRLALVIVLFASLPGCPMRTNGLVALPFREPPCRLPPGMPMPQIVAHLNRNISGLYSWRSTNVRIHTSGPGGVPIRLSGMIAVQSPRNFRLMVNNTLGGHEADLGSNDERFWFWVRRGGLKNVLTASHDQMELVQQRLPIPFEPDWLMEAFGVIPIDQAQFQVQQPPAGSRLTSFVAQQTLPSGRQVQRILLVDTCQGYIVAHELRDSRNTLLARAELNKYRIDAATGIALPHEIHLDWPQANMLTTLHIGEIEVNPDPGTISAATWQMQEHPGYPTLDLGSRSAREYALSAAPLNRATTAGAEHWEKTQPSVAGKATIRQAVQPDPFPAERDEHYAPKSSPPAKRHAFRFNWFRPTARFWKR